MALHVFSTFAVGGPQVRFAAIANRFGPAFRHAVVAMDGNFVCRERLDAGLDVTFPPLAIRKGATFDNLRAFRAVLRALRPDVLVTSNWGTIEWAMANALAVGRPLIRHVHMEDGFGPEERARQLPRRVLTRRVALRGSTVLLPSRTLSRIATEMWRLAPERLRYVPNGVDPGRFACPPAELPAGEGPVIGTVAALRPEKNLPRLLRAFSLLPRPARLVIVGNGPERGGLVALARELGIGDTVHFAGHVAEPAPFYRAFDVFALSSDTEQMPLSVLEAMAAGLPVAGTDVGDMRMMVADANAPFIVSCEETALARSLGELLREASRRREIGEANHARVRQEFEQEAMFQAHAALLRGEG